MPRTPNRVQKSAVHVSSRSTAVSNNNGTSSLISHRSHGSGSVSQGTVSQYFSSLGNSSLPFDGVIPSVVSPHHSLSSLSLPRKSYDKNSDLLSLRCSIASDEQSHTEGGITWGDVTVGVISEQTNHTDATRVVFDDNCYDVNSKQMCCDEISGEDNGVDVVDIFQLADTILQDISTETVAHNKFDSATIDTAHQLTHSKSTSSSLTGNTTASANISSCKISSLSNSCTSKFNESISKRESSIEILKQQLKTANTSRIRNDKYRLPYRQDHHLTTSSHRQLCLPPTSATDVVEQTQEYGIRKDTDKILAHCKPRITPPVRQKHPHPVSSNSTPKSSSNSKTTILKVLDNHVNGTSDACLDGQRWSCEIVIPGLWDEGSNSPGHEHRHPRWAFVSRQGTEEKGSSNDGSDDAGAGALSAGVHKSSHTNGSLGNIRSDYGDDDSIVVMSNEGTSAGAADVQSSVQRASDNNVAQAGEAIRRPLLLTPNNGNTSACGSDIFYSHPMQQQHNLVTVSRMPFVRGGLRGVYTPCHLSSFVYSSSLSPLVSEEINMSTYNNRNNRPESRSQLSTPLLLLQPPRQNLSQTSHVRPSVSVNLLQEISNYLDMFPYVMIAIGATLVTAQTSHTTHKAPSDNAPCPDKTSSFALVKQGIVELLLLSPNVFDTAALLEKSCNVHNSGSQKMERCGVRFNMLSALKEAPHGEATHGGHMGCSTTLHSTTAAGPFSLFPTPICDATQSRRNTISEAKYPPLLPPDLFNTYKTFLEYMRFGDTFEQAEMWNLFSAKSEDADIQHDRGHIHQQAALFNDKKTLYTILVNTCIGIAQQHLPVLATALLESLQDVVMESSYSVNGKGGTDTNSAKSPPRWLSVKTAVNGGHSSYISLAPIAYLADRSPSLKMSIGFAALANLEDFLRYQCYTTVSPSSVVSSDMAVTEDLSQLRQYMMNCLRGSAIVFREVLTESDLVRALMQYTASRCHRGVTGSSTVEVPKTGPIQLPVSSAFSALTLTQILTFVISTLGSDHRIPCSSTATGRDYISRLPSALIGPAIYSSPIRVPIRSSYVSWAAVMAPIANLVATIPWPTSKYLPCAVYNRGLDQWVAHETLDSSLRGIPILSPQHYGHRCNRSPMARNDEFTSCITPIHAIHKRQRKEDRINSTHTNLIITYDPMSRMSQPSNMLPNTPNIFSSRTTPRHILSNASDTRLSFPIQQYGPGSLNGGSLHDVAVLLDILMSGMTEVMKIEGSVMDHHASTAHPNRSTRHSFPELTSFRKHYNTVVCPYLISSNMITSPEIPEDNMSQCSSHRSALYSQMDSRGASMSLSQSSQHATLSSQTSFFYQQQHPTLHGLSHTHTNETPGSHTR